MKGSKWGDTRRCMPLTEWPAADRAAWERAIQPGGPFDEPGLAANWRQKSQKYVIDAYGRLLTHLLITGRLDSNASVESRLTPEMLRPFLHEIKQQVAPATVAGRFRGLAEAARVMAPGVDFAHLKRARSRLKRQAYPSRNKRTKLQPIQKLAELGFKLMREAESGEFFRAVGRAGQYRDGLIILLLACRPLRRENLASIELGRHLTKSNECYQLSFPAPEMKNRQSYVTTFDAVLAPYIDRYLATFRPILLKGVQSDRLWIAMGGSSMTANSLYGMIRMRTLAEFGVAINPHLFRDAAVTSLGSEKPELAWVGMSLLNHTDPRTTEAHYDHALSDKAVGQYQDSIRRRRKRLTTAAQKDQPTRLERKAS